MAGRGGARKGAGRPKVTAETHPEADKKFATGVLARIGKQGWESFTDRKKIKSAEDYALHILAQDDGEAHSFFRYMLDRRYGKPAQSVINADTRESSRELDFGDLPMPAGQPGEAGKPN